MSTAFEITMEDVYGVIGDMDNSDSIPLDEVFAEKVLTMLDFARIEDMALCGDDMDEQTNYANDEIRNQIITGNLLEIADDDDFYEKDENVGHPNV